MAQVDREGKFQKQNVQISKTQCLGQGSFGVVYKAQCNLLPCAAKVIRSDLFDTSDSSFSREAALETVERGFDRLVQIRHPNIVQCLGTHQDDTTGLPVLLMEFVQENLTSFLHHNPPLSSHLHMQVNISYDIALALHHLHSNGIIHGNISSNNILLSPSHQAKITDIRMFDFPAATSKNVSSRSSCPWNCAIDYMPPEAFDKTKVCNEKLDCFSAGVIGIQVITGLYPEPSPKFQRVKSSAGVVVTSVQEVDRRQSHISLIDKAHPLLPILTKCLQDKTTERPTSHDLCTCLAGLKEHAVYQKSLDSSVKFTHEQSTDGLLHEDVTGLPVRVVTNVAREKINRANSDQSPVEKDKLQSKDQVIKALSSEVEEKCAALVEREAQLERLKKERFELSVSLQHLQKEMTAMKKKNDGLEQEVVSKEREIKLLQLRGPAANAKNGTHSVSTMTWRKSLDAPFAGKLGSVTALGDLVCIRVAGSSEIHICDTLNHEWFLTPPCPLDACSLVAVKNTLTVVGGRIDASVTNLLYSIHLKSFQAVKKQPWREQFPAMLTKRMFAMAVSSANILAVAGGWNGHQALRTVEILRLDRDPLHWNRVMSLPSPVYSASACICRGKLYVLGGFTQKGPTKAVLSASVHSLLDSTKDSVWHRPTSLPTYRSTCVAFDDHLLSFGGENNESQQELSANDNNRETGAVFEYSSTDGEWCLISEMPVPRCQSCVAVLAERREIMVMGGHSGCTGRTQTVQFASLEL